MKLTGISISKNRRLCKQVKALYRSAFPKEELLPWPLMRLLTLREGASIRGWMDGDTFCGFTYSATVNGFCFVMFFAVEPGLRGQGYGSAILEALKAEAPTVPVILNIEPILDTAPNLQERKNRLAFYQKNGFFDTGFMIREVGGVFTVMATCPKIDPEQYARLFRYISFGFWHVTVKPADQWNLS
ncbi:MAG: GNAT family N-acetyltransferase [Ruminococcaceae bacterium]|nr:GNAT family N-acetyltransferase [Oscillospiraceae bacterium]